MPLVFSILGLGFLLGIRHATDADHVAAVTTIVAKQKKFYYSSLIGVLWGIGHTITITLVAIPIIFFSLTIPSGLGLAFEFGVGIMLIILGVLTLVGFLTAHSHSHKLEKGILHSHSHVHFGAGSNKHAHHLGLFHIIRPIIVGLIHGLAGSTAITLLILSTINQPQLAILYLFIFNIGVIVGMMIITALLGTTVAIVKKRSAKIHKYLVVVSGIVSFIFGLFIMYKTAIVGGLFSAV